jgi:hypothetical protein
LISSGTPGAPATLSAENAINTVPCNIRSMIDSRLAAYCGEAFYRAANRNVRPYQTPATGVQIH